MNKEYLIQGLINKNIDIYEFLYKYCIYKGKDVNLTQTFLQSANMMGFLPTLYNYAINIMCQEYCLTIVTDLKTNQILYVNEFKRDSIADNQEHAEKHSESTKEDGAEGSKKAEDAE